MRELERKLVEHARKNWIRTLTYPLLGSHYALYTSPDKDIRIAVHEGDNELISITRRGVTLINPRDIERIMNVLSKKM